MEKKENVKERKKSSVREKKESHSRKEDKSVKNEPKEKESNKIGKKILENEKKPSEKVALTDIYERVVYLFLKNLNPKYSLISCMDNPSLASVFDNVHAAMSMWATSIAMLKNLKFNARKPYVQLLKNSKEVMLAVMRCFEFQIESGGPYCQHFPGIDPLVYVDLKTGEPIDVEQGGQIKQAEEGPSKIEVVAVFLLVLVQMQCSGLKLVETLEHSLVVQNLLIFVQSTYLKIETDIETSMDGIKFEDPSINISTIGMIKGVLDAYHAVTTQSQFSRVFGLLPLVTFQYEVVQIRLLLGHVLKKVMSLKCFTSNASSLSTYPSFSIRGSRMQILEKEFDDLYNNKKRDAAFKSVLDKDRLQVNCNLCLSALFIGKKKKSHFEFLEQYGMQDLEQSYKSFEEATGSDSTFTFYYSQALLILVSLLYEGYLVGRDIDALSMVSGMDLKEQESQEVHVVVITESEGVKAALRKRGVLSQSIGGLVSKGFKLYPDHVLVRLLNCLACDYKKPKMFENEFPKSLMDDVKDFCTNHNSSNVMQTSQLYSLRKYNMLFVPKLLGKIPSYLDFDISMFCDSVINNIKFIQRNWISSKNPLFIIPLSNLSIDISTEFPTELDRIFRKLKSGFLGGVRVKMIKLTKSIDNYLVTSLDILATSKNSADDQLSILRLEDYSLKPVEEESSQKTNSSFRPSFNFRLALGRLKGSKSEQVQSKTKQTSQQQEELLKASALESEEKSEEPAKEEVSHVHDFSSITTLAPVSANRASADELLKNDHKHVQCMLQQRRYLNAKWKHLDLNWLPEQIIDFIIAESSSTEMVGMNDHDCVKMLATFDTSNNFMEKARIIKKLHSLKGLNWRPSQLEGFSSTTTKSDVPRSSDGSSIKKESLPRNSVPSSPTDMSTMIYQMQKDGASKDLRDALVQMYRISSCCQTWWMARYAGGLLGLHIEGLTTAMTSIINNHQRQVIFGCYPNNKIVLAKPRKDLDIITLIQIVTKSNPFMISLLQEILIYAWMVCQFNPTLVDQFVCIDLQAIYQSILTDIAFRFSCNDTMAAVYLACLSPFQLKCFVEVTLRGEEIISASDIFELGRHLSNNKTSGFIENIDTYLQPGVWMKRRSLDGVLTRLPDSFISRVWWFLRQCKGLTLEGHILKTEITYQYSEANLNFVAILYRTLRSIKPVELREIYIEAMYLLSSLLRNIRIKVDSNQVINLTEVVNAAVNLFLKNQHTDKDFRILRTCCTPARNIRKPPIANDEICKIKGGGYCFQFYDSAPTGEFGTLSFFSDAIVHLFTKNSAVPETKAPPKSEKKVKQRT